MYDNKKLIDEFYLQTAHYSFKNLKIAIEIYWENFDIIKPKASYVSLNNMSINVR